MEILYLYGEIGVDNAALGVIRKAQSQIHCKLCKRPLRAKSEDDFNEVYCEIMQILRLDSTKFCVRVQNICCYSCSMCFIKQKINANANFCSFASSLSFLDSFASKFSDF